MKLKMAPNSLFAILLRKPWWVSLLLAAILATVALALLPQELKAVGAISGLPIAVLGLVALKRQWGQPGAREVQALTRAAEAMGWPAFCKALEQGFARQGWTVARAAGVADLLLEREGRRVLVAARRWKAARHGEEAIRALMDAVAAQQADGGVYVTLGELSANARRLAAQHGIELVEAPQLAQVLRGVPLPAS